MTAQQFDSATYYVQSTMVRMHGHFLIKRKDGNRMVELFDLDGFYVELSYLKNSSKLGLMRSLSVLEIDDYLSLIDISEATELLK